MKKWYKIVEQKNGQLKTLFHGVNGSRNLILNQWLDAVIKNVSDGKGTQYTSGWHIMDNYEECAYYLTKFKNQDTKKIICCHAKNVRKKSHSPNNVYLAEKLFILDHASSQ